jgi:hypothetical protein
MRKIALIAVVFAATLAAVGCGTTPSTKPLGGTGTTPPSGK